MTATPSIAWPRKLRWYVGSCVSYACRCERVHLVHEPVPRYLHRETGVPRRQLLQLLGSYAPTVVSGSELVAARAAAAEAMALFAQAIPTRELLGVASPTSAMRLSDWHRVWIEVQRLARANALARWHDELLALDPALDPVRVVLLVAACGHREAAIRLARAVVPAELPPVARAWIAWFLDELPVSAIGALAHDAHETEPRFLPARARADVVTAALCGRWEDVRAKLPPMRAEPEHWGAHRMLDAFANLDTPGVADRLRAALASTFARMEPFEPPWRTRVSFELVGMLPLTAYQPSPAALRETISRSRCDHPRSRLHGTAARWRCSPRAPRGDRSRDRRRRRRARHQLARRSVPGLDRTDPLTAHGPSGSP